MANIYEEATIGYVPKIKDTLRIRPSMYNSYYAPKAKRYVRKPVGQKSPKTGVEDPVKGVGIVIYKYENRKLYFLLASRKTIDGDYVYEDLGGKILPSDTDYIQTAMREVREETNNVLTKGGCMERRLREEAAHVYIPQSKYMLYFIPARDWEKKLRPEYFGECRSKHNVKSISWVSYRDFVCRKWYHPRFAGKNLFMFLKTLTPVMCKKQYK